MGVWGTAALFLIVAWGCAVVAAAAWTRAYRPPDGEPIPLPTADGWTVWVHRFRPEGPARGLPVILGHGFMMNRWCWSLSESGSMPARLAAAGFDVFVAEYRGSGRGRVPPEDRHYLKRAAGLDGWGFDDHVQLDVPAIIDGVREITGADRVHWVGHSMGGMLGYAHSLYGGAEGLASVVTLGSPTRFEHVSALFGPTGPAARRLLTLLPKIHTRFFMLLALPFAVFAPQVVLRTSGSKRWLTRFERMSLLAEAFEDTSPALAGFFMDRWLHDRHLIPQEAGSYSDLPVPTLVIAGASDVLAPPRAARVPFEETETDSVAYRLFGDPHLPPEIAGPDLGHADLISGDVAMEHTLPLLISWLGAEDPLAAVDALPGVRRSGRPSQAAG